MFAATSMTGVGILVLAAKYLLSFLGIVDIDDTTLERGISGLVDFIAIGMTVIGQLRRKDLKMGLIRIK